VLYPATNCNINFEFAYFNKHGSRKLCGDCARDIEFLLLLYFALPHQISAAHFSLNFEILNYQNFVLLYNVVDRLCGLVVKVLGYRSGGPGSIPGTTRKKKE
jgi:hypothetical protein